MCKNSCNECPRKVFSQTVTVAAIDGVDTVLINIPAQTFVNGQCGCFVIVQNIPTTAAIATPVAVTIGNDTTTAYPLVRCDCTQVTACAIRSRRRYPFKVATNATGGVFKIRKNLSCAPNVNLQTIPSVDTTTTPPVGG